jgi:hypothetical protein
MFLGGGGGGGSGGVGVSPLVEDEETAVAYPEEICTGSLE